MRYAGIGGLSSVLGWTAVQQEEGKTPFSFNNVITLGLIFLAIDAGLFAYQFFEYYQANGTIFPVGK